MSENFQDADRFGCEECPRNLKNREYLQQRGVSVSGVDGRPKSNPVLEAIDAAMLKPKGNKWHHKSGREEFCPSYANEALMKVKAVYLQSHAQGPEVAGRTTGYYVCPNCQCPIDMTGTGLDGLSAPGDGGEFMAGTGLDGHVAPGDGEEFERAIAILYPDGDYHGAIHRITTAHNADRAADKRRIAELEAQIDGMKAMAEVYGKVMSRINKSCEAAGCRQGEDMADFIARLGTRIFELEAELLAKDEVHRKEIARLKAAICVS